MSQVDCYAPSYKIVVNGKELQHGANVDVLSLKVTDTNDRADTFSFTVRERHPDHKRLFAGGEKLAWMDSKVFKVGNEVEIHMGYVDDLHLMLRGKIKAVAPNFPASGQPTVQVQGFSPYHDLQQRRRREPYENATDSDIAKEIAKDMGLKAQVDDTKTKHALYSPKGASYEKILRERAKRIGYEVVAKDGTLYFQKPGYRSNPNPVLTFEWGLNLISFSPRLSTHNTVAGVRTRGSQTTQGGVKKPFVGEAKAGDERVKMGKKTGNQIAQDIDKKNKKNWTIIRDHDVGSQDEANEMSLSHLEALALEFISGSASAIGDPQIRARIVVKLKGLGRSFSGNYYVTSATHTIDGSGYRTTFEVKRNAQ
jgi:phage protein D